MSKKQILYNRKFNFFIFLNFISILNSFELFGEKFKSIPETPLGFYDQIAPRRMQTGGGGKDKPLPKSVCLKMTPAKDQGPIGTCVSFAVSACAEHQHKAALSEAELTVLAETKMRGGDCRPGLNMGQTLKIAHEYGLVEEREFSYQKYLKVIARSNGIDSTSRTWKSDMTKKGDDLRICTVGNYNTTMRNYGVALRLHGDPKVDKTDYKVNSLEVLHHVSQAAVSQAKGIGKPVLQETTRHHAGAADIDAVKRALAGKRPVACAVGVYQKCWDADSIKDNDTIKMPGKTSKLRGSHAVVLCGYSDKKGAFIVKNSWGKKWGSKGYAYIPYDYVKAYATELVAVGK